MSRKEFKDAKSDMQPMIPNIPIITTDFRRMVALAFVVLAMIGLCSIHDNIESISFDLLMGFLIFGTGFLGVAISFMLSPVNRFIFKFSRELEIGFSIGGVIAMMLLMLGLFVAPEKDSGGGFLVAWFLFGSISSTALIVKHKMSRL